ERAVAPGGGGARRARGWPGRVVPTGAAHGSPAWGWDGGPARAPEVSRLGRSHAPGVRNGCPLVSAVRGADDRAGDDRGSGCDPADTDASRALHGGRGSVAGRAGVAVGGGLLRIEARLTPAA